MGKTFSERYVVARFPAGGVVVDLVTGNYYRINRSAALVCEALSQSQDSTQANDLISRELGIPRDEAARAVQEVAASLSRSEVRGEIQGAYHFYPSSAGYELRHGDRRVLEVDHATLGIRLGPDARSESAGQLELYFRALAPKLLFQTGTMVLHASACRFRGEIVAFAGLSGAGKTTTALAFRSAGADLISEDLVVLTSAAGGTIAIDGETAVHDWAAQMARTLSSNRSTEVFPAGLWAAPSGPTAPLSRILILDRDRRAGTEFSASPLVDADAVTAVMSHDFLGAREPGAWRRFLQQAVALVESVEVAGAWAPDGIQHLTDAARRYMSRTAS